MVVRVTNMVDEVMRAIAALILIFVAALATGCASHPEPIIDTKGVDQERLARDWRECEALSEQVEPAQGIARGAGLGAAVGAVAGAIGGDSDDVAGGAGHGALYGGVSSGLRGSREKQEVFKRCMRGRHYRVLN